MRRRGRRALRRAARAALLLGALVALGGCRSTVLVGSVSCTSSADCNPPDLICGADGRCIAGCATDPDGCPGATLCNLASGECEGGVAGGACSRDSDCDPPDLVCRVGTGTCVLGCAAGADCPTDQTCNRATGHCCAADDPTCPAAADLGPTCNSDPECVGAPRNICSGGVCVPGCLGGGAACVAPAVCNTSSGRCHPPTCARDLECDDGSFCTQDGRCAVLAYAGPIACAGGTRVTFQCAIERTASEFEACVGPPGPAGCPYCIDNSCLQPGLCTGDGECHAGTSCRSGLCLVNAPACPTVVAIADVLAGRYAAGKEVCVQATVTALRSGYDGMFQVRLDSGPYLWVEIPPMYEEVGVRLPDIGQLVTVHGTVRWDEAHGDRELLPVDSVE